MLLMWLGVMVCHVLLFVSMQALILREHDLMVPEQ